MAFLILLLLTADPTARVHQEIVVTAERSAVPRDELTTATTILTSAEIEAAPATNAAEVLALVPGMSVFSASSTVPATLTLRGFYGGGEADYTRLLVETAAWEKRRNAERARINWMFTTEKARAKMGRAYPKPAGASGPRQ